MLQIRSNPLLCRLCMQSLSIFILYCRTPWRFPDLTSSKTLDRTGCGVFRQSFSSGSCQCASDRNIARNKRLQCRRLCHCSTRNRSVTIHPLFKRPARKHLAYPAQTPWHRESTAPYDVDLICNFDACISHKHCTLILWRIRRCLPFE